MQVAASPLLEYNGAIGLKENEEATMSEEEAPLCPECGQELWYDEEDEVWVCDNCGLELYEEEEWEEEEEEEEEED